MKNMFYAFLMLPVLSCSGMAQSAGQIVPGKQIRIEIQGVPNEEKGRIDAMYPVSEAGSINMPFIGIVQAAGLLPEQLAATIQARYRNAGIYTSPTIQIVSDSGGEGINQLQIFVGGQVRRTGSIPYSQGLTLYQAVQAAGGATEFGSMKRVSIFRAGKKTTFDLTKGQFMSIPVAPKDTIEVPQKNVWGN